MVIEFFGRNGDMAYTASARRKSETYKKAGIEALFLMRDSLKVTGRPEFSARLKVCWKTGWIYFINVSMAIISLKLKITLDKEYVQFIRGRNSTNISSIFVLLLSSGRKSL